jgi:signal transduction histidine kinase
VSEPALLLLDDDAGILRLQRKALEAAGYRVATAQSTGEARERLSAGSCALLVLDYRLESGQSGLEFYQQLRGEGRDVPAVLVTAFSDESKLVEALRAGVRDVIPKSGEYLEYLPQAIGRVMRQIAAERQAVENEALRRSEERLRALNADLARSERQLREQARQLADANRNKDIFLATLAHELRSPLAPIRYALALLRDLPPDQTRARDVIDRQVTHLVRLVDDLLDVSRITRDKIPLRPARVRLAPIMREAVESVQPEVEAAGHTLTVCEPDEDVWLQADAARLAQVFTNLLNNAVRYTPRGGSIGFSAEATGAEARVVVTDSGTGIGPDHLPHVFDMFYQAPGARDLAAGGLGLGLMLVRRIVEMHGGRVEAHSEGPGRGAEFVVRLPRAAAGSADVSALATTPADHRGRRALRVLVVDDNVDSADLLSLVVEQLGHSVRTAHEGDGATATFGEFQPDVALMDVRLPGTSGYDLARRFRQERGAGLCLVAITGWGQGEDKRRAREAGFDCHLVKPAEPELIERILDCVAAGTPCGACPKCAEAAGRRAAAS